MKTRALIIPALITLLGLAVTIGLGVWQLERRVWKLDIIQRIETRIHAEPVPLARAVELWRRDRDVDYLRVRLTGQFLHGQERHYYDISDGSAGWDIITPLVTSGGDVVLVNRGFVPDALKPAETRPQGLVSGGVELTGLARAPGTQGRFVPDNDPAGNRWYWRDVPALLASLRGVDPARAVPFMVEAEAAPVPGGWPQGGATRLVIPNNHLQYAITWFSLAVALATIFAIYARGGA